MDSDSDGGARSAVRPSPLQALRRQWREKHNSAQPTPPPARRLSDLLAAAESPQDDAGEDILAAVRQDEARYILSSGVFEDAPPSCQGHLPESPSEDAFVAARASVRRDAYLKLEMWLLAGGCPEPFAPWFRELLMDTDAEAFVAACRAVASHYRRAAQQRALGQEAAAAPCRPWLPGFLERLREGGPERLKEAAELVAAVLAAPRPSAYSQRHEFFDDLGALEPLPPGAQELLRACEVHQALHEEDLEQLRDVVAPALFEAPEIIIQAPTSPAPEQGSFLTSPLRPTPGPEDPLRLLGCSSPKSWRRRLEALESIQGPDADGVHGQLLWPQLVLQAEDDHPAVAAASLRCLARLAPLLSAPGDHLLARLAAAVKGRCKGRLRDQESARALLGAAARCPRAVGGPAGLGAFLGLALGLQKERAKAVVLELMAERHQPSTLGGSALPAALESLLSEIGKLRPPDLRRGGFTPSPSRKRALLASPEFCRQSPRISPVQKATPSTTSPVAFLAFAEALPDPDSVPPLCRFASPVKAWKQVQHWDTRTPDTTRGSVTSCGPSLPSESRLLRLSQVASPECLADTQSTAMATTPEDLNISPPEIPKEVEDDEDEAEEDEGSFLESLLERLRSEDPKALAKALATVRKERAGGAVNFLLTRALAPPPGLGSAKTAELLHSFVEELTSRGDERGLRDLDLPSLPAVAEAAAAGRLGAALPALSRALEPLLKHLAPGAVPEQCWTQLRRILTDRPRSEEALRESAAPPEVEVSAAELAELSATFQKLHRITTALSRPASSADEVLLPLRQASQILSRPQAQGPLRGFLRRLRARRAAKENIPPLSKTAAGRLQTSNGDDYAAAREQAAEEGFVGAFPSSLWAPLRRLLGPGPALAQREAAEVAAACARACGAPLLRGLLSLAAPLLKVASSRGPAQGAARTALAQMCAQSWSSLRATWRALMQAILANSTNGRPGTAGMVDQGSGQLLEIFRALEETWPQLSAASDVAAGRQAMGEFLAVAAPCCIHSSSQLRSAAARTLRGAAAALGPEAVEEGLGTAGITGAAAAAARAALLAADNPEPARRAPSVAKSSPLIPDCALRAESEAAPSTSQPRRLHFSPTPDTRGETSQGSRRCRRPNPESQAESPAPAVALEGSSDAAADLKAEVEAATEELAAGLVESTDWPGRAGALRAQLQELASRSRDDTTAALLRAMLVFLWRLALAAVASPEEISKNLLKAVCEAASACRGFPSTAFADLGATAPFQCLLQTLACLQSLSQQPSASIRRASGPALLELPPLMAQTMDAVEAEKQFLAWLRVARELLTDPSLLQTPGRPQKSEEDGRALREWALRFCLRAARRCGEAPGDGTGLTTWEVLSEMTALREVLDDQMEGDWLPLLEAVALRLAETRHAEAREFAQLAAMAGRPLLRSLQKLAGPVGAGRGPQVR